ncbi:hypothetical protein [Streptomyces sp. NBC_00385]|uniref:hypothetical protein n=1 Tax=Streptomyces sp. NBC_00385 TaxID=2975733 RepID=UPI002DD8634E|nr:hypothetical protein [Streptomyces sp. NBC_00385]WRZ06038.1 hypothetical protein OG959_23205 [Streptomyces sp. NBC_00385]
MNPNIHRTPSSPTPSLAAIATAQAEFAANPLAVALVTADELADVLHRLGITLPSLGPDLASCTTTTAPRPLIELGRVNLTTAARLTDVLRRTAQADAE